MNYLLKIKKNAKENPKHQHFKYRHINTANFSIYTRFHNGSEKHYKRTPNTAYCPQGLYSPEWKDKVVRNIGQIVPVEAKPFQ